MVITDYENDLDLDNMYQSCVPFPKSFVPIGISYHDKFSAFSCMRDQEREDEIGNSHYKLMQDIRCVVLSHALHHVCLVHIFFN